MNIIDSNIIKINYSYYAEDKEIYLDLINTMIYKIAIPSQGLTQNFALELQFEDFKIRQYPNYWFDGSAWKQDVIDDVYDKLIELQKQAKQI